MTTEIIQRAINRARGRADHVHFRYADDHNYYADYNVDSSDGQHTYLVTVIGPEYRCTCPGGNHPCCWHRAAVASLRLSRLAHGLPADGPSAEDTALAQASFEAQAFAPVGTVHPPGFEATLATVRALFDR